MKIFSLIFDYNLSKMKDTGRPWAETAYKNKNFIFEYSAASIATFLHHNPHLHYEVLTDDVDLLARNVDAYSVDTRNLTITDANDLIKEWSSHWYCFWPLIKSFDHFVSEADGGVLKLDNDLTCLKPIDDLLKHDGAIVWKTERLCSQGKDRWGEKHAARLAFGTDKFYVYNTGTWGLSHNWAERAREIPDLCNSMINVNVTDVVRFPESPDTRTRVFNTSDQVSNCYFVHKHDVPVKESHQWFDHHCYGHDAKKNCIHQANHLKR